MDVFKATDNDSYSLTFKIIGGVFDFRGFMGGTDPTTALSKFQ
jgi:hypothetical protein